MMQSGAAAESGIDSVVLKAVKMVVVAETVAILILVGLLMVVNKENAETISKVGHLKFRIVMEEE